MGKFFVQKKTKNEWVNVEDFNDLLDAQDMCWEYESDLLEKYGDKSEVRIIDSNGMICPF